MSESEVVERRERGALPVLEDKDELEFESPDVNLADARVGAGETRAIT